MMFKKTMLIISLFIPSATNYAMENVDPVMAMAELLGTNEEFVTHMVAYVKNTFGFTKLMRAASIGNLDEARSQLAPSANCDEQDIYGQTALILASQYNYPEIVELLLQTGAKPDIENNSGLTALKIAILNSSADNKNTETVSLLLQAGANPNQKNLRGQKVLIVAAQKGSPEIARLLLQHGADYHPGLRPKIGRFKLENLGGLLGALGYSHRECFRFLENWPFYQQALKRSLFMATHPRCGAESPAKIIYPDIVEMIASLLYQYHTTQQINKIAEQEKALQAQQNSLKSYAQRFLKKNLYGLVPSIHKRKFEDDNFEGPSKKQKL